MIAEVAALLACIAFRGTGHRYDTVGAAAATTMCCKSCQAVPTNLQWRLVAAASSIPSAAITSFPIFVAVFVFVVVVSFFVSVSVSVFVAAATAAAAASVVVFAVAVAVNHEAEEQGILVQGQRKLLLQRAVLQLQRVVLAAQIAHLAHQLGLKCCRVQIVVCM